MYLYRTQLTTFIYSLEASNKGKSIPVTDAETSQPSCSKGIANNREVNNKKKANKHSLAVKDGENPRNKRKILFSSLECNKKHHSDNCSFQYQPHPGGGGGMLQIPMRMITDKLR